MLTILNIIQGKKIENFDLKSCLGPFNIKQCWFLLLVNAKLSMIQMEQSNNWHFYLVHSKYSD